MRPLTCGSRKSGSAWFVLPAFLGLLGWANGHQNLPVFYFLQVRDASPNNVEALTQILDYNLDYYGSSQPARIFTGADVDFASGNGALCIFCCVS